MRELARTHVRSLVRRYLRNETGEVLTWLLVISLLWLIISGSRVVVQ